MLGTEDKIVNKTKALSDGINPPGRGEASVKSPGGWMSLGSRVAAVRVGKRGQLALSLEKEVSCGTRRPGNLGVRVWIIFQVGGNVLH